MAFYFRCARTALLYPADYVEQWGRRYGHGLGSQPVSEALVNDYHLRIAESTDPLLSMHPVSVCRAQVDLVDIPDGDPQLTARMAVVAQDDPAYTIRGDIMRTRQREHSPQMARIYSDEQTFRSARSAQIKPVTAIKKPLK